LFEDFRATAPICTVGVEPDRGAGGGPLAGPVWLTMVAAKVAALQLVDGLREKAMTLSPVWRYCPMAIRAKPFDGAS